MSDLLNKASLVMIPSGYKEDVVYSAVPSDGSGDLSLTRASNGTRINSAGLVEVTPWNLLSNSENFSVQSQAGSTIGTNVTTAPNGTTTADSLIEDSSTGSHAVFNFGALTYVAGQYTISCYVKKGIRDWVRIQLYDATTSASVWANLNTGVLGTVTGTSATIENIGNDWYRVTMLATLVSATGGWAIYSTTADNSTSYTGTNGATSLYIWGVQINNGALKPYFPTTDRLNVPRLTYQNGGGGCPSLLLEKQSTNLLTYSEQFDNAAWTKDRVTVTANAIISPDGTQNADKFVDSLNGSNTYRIYNSLTLSATTYTMTVYAKAAEYSWCYIRIGNSLRAWYNVSTGTVGTVAAGLTAKIENAGNGWYKLTCTIATATAGGGFGLVGLATGDNVETYTPTTGGMGIYVWGAQLEASSYPTSYIPTTSASATRVADACFKTGISSLIGQSEGVLFADINPEEFVNGSYIGITDGTVTNRIIMGFEGGSVNSGTFKVYGKTGLFGTGTYTRGQRMKIALAYKSGNSALYINGTQVETSTTTFTASFSAFRFDSYAGSQNFIGNVNESLLFPTRLTNAELQSLTTL